MKKVIIALCVSALAPAAWAQVVKEATPKVTAVTKLQSPCGSVKAQKSLTLDEASVSASSGLKYSQGKCNLFVVDITVPADTKVEGYLDTFTITRKYDGKVTASETVPNTPNTLPITKAQCGKYEDYTLLYQQNSDGKWAFVDGTMRKGKWIPERTEFPKSPAHCETELTNANDLATLKVGDAPAYRVAFGAKIGTGWRKVMAGAAFDRVPPPPPK